MAEFIIFGRDIPWSELEDKKTAYLEIAEEQNKSSREKARDLVEITKEFFDDQKIWMEKQDNKQTASH